MQMRIIQTHKRIYVKTQEKWKLGIRNEKLGYDRYISTT